METSSDSMSSSISKKFIEGGKIPIDKTNNIGNDGGHGRQSRNAHYKTPA